MVICKYKNVSFGVNYIKHNWLRKMEESLKVEWIELYDDNDEEFYEKYKDHSSSIYIHSDDKEIPIYLITALINSEEFQIFQRDYDISQLLG